jgi:aminomethyltransferase
MGARLIPFGGWAMPVEYSGIAKEHTAVRTAAGLFDVSHMGEFEVEGAEALDLIQLVTSNDASRLVDGQVQYSALPTEEGGVVDDLLVYRKAADRYMLVVNASNIDKDFNWITSRNRFDARLKNVSDQTALLPFSPRAQKPQSDQTPLGPIRYYHFAQGRLRRSGCNSLPHELHW